VRLSSGDDNRISGHYDVGADNPGGGTLSMTSGFTSPTTTSDGSLLLSVARPGYRAPGTDYILRGGFGARGGSSYTDSVVLPQRNKDLDRSSILEKRVYFCQNWRDTV
jgi:hypothetical protein